jgi:hypothetical protein
MLVFNMVEKSFSAPKMVVSRIRKILCARLQKYLLIHRQEHAIVAQILGRMDAILLSPRTPMYH